MAEFLKLSDSNSLDEVKSALSKSDILRKSSPFVDGFEAKITGLKVVTWQLSNGNTTTKPVFDTDHNVDLPFATLCNPRTDKFGVEHTKNGSLSRQVREVLEQNTTADTRYAALQQFIGRTFRVHRHDVIELAYGATQEIDFDLV